MDSLKIKLSKVEPVTMNIPTLDKQNFKQFKSPFKPSDDCYIEFNTTLDRISWRLQAITELEDAGLSDTERCSCLRAEVSGLFAWANGMITTYWSSKDEN